MTRTILKALALAALVGLSALTLPATAEAGRGWAAMVGAATATMAADGADRALGRWPYRLRRRRGIRQRPCAPVYADPYVDARLRHRPLMAGCRRYGPPPWSPDWYDYCAQRYRSFNARTGYFMGYDGRRISASRAMREP